MSTEQHSIGKSLALHLDTRRVMGIFVHMAVNLIGGMLITVRVLGQ